MRGDLPHALYSLLFGFTIFMMLSSLLAVDVACSLLIIRDQD